MIDLMMWIVIAAILLAAAIQGVGYYRESVILYHLKNDAIGAAANVKSSAAQDEGFISQPIVDAGLINTKWSDGTLHVGKANDKRSYSITAGNPEITKSVVYCSLGGITVVPNTDLASFVCGTTVVAAPPIGGGTGGDGDDDGDDGGVITPTANGMLAGWGWAINNQIGNGPLPTTTNYGPFHNKTVTQLDAHGDGGCVLADGVLWCWPLGSFNPVNQQASGILADKTVTALSTGFSFNCVIASGDAYCKGKNNYGQLGSGMAVATNATSGANYVAVSKSGVLAGKTLKAINAGTQHACAVDTDNKVYCWGNNAFGSLGNGNRTASNVPVAVYMDGALAGVTIQDIDISHEGTCVLDTLGRVYCWGLASNTGTYMSGTNSPGPSMNFEWVPVRTGDKGPLVGKTVTQLDASAARICVIANDNLQYCWGNALSVAANTPSLSMSGLPAGETVKQLSGTCLLMTNNKSYCYLSSATFIFTQLAGTETPPVSGMLITDISENCFMIDGQPWCSNGPWATTSTKISRDVVVTLDKYLVPMAVGGSVLEGKDLTQVTAGGSHSCGATKTEMYCWGRNANGQLGDGTATNAEWPVRVQGISGDITSIATGKTSTCAIANQLPYCWGNGYAGQLGNGDTAPRSTPTLVDMTGALSGKTLKEIGAGEDFACALDTEGRIYCWGTGYDGQLGNGGIEETNVSPVAVAGSLAGKTVTDLDVGPYNVCAVADGTPYCWGANGDEQFDASYNAVPLPVAKGMGGVTVVSVAVSYSAFCALGSDQKVYCWGAGWSGELGDGTYDANYTPKAVDVPGSVTMLDAGESHVCAATGASLYCWGDGYYGPLGTGTTGDSTLPVLTTDPSTLFSSKSITGLGVGGRNTFVVYK